jgi:hypothetical protein
MIILIKQSALDVILQEGGRSYRYSDASYSKLAEVILNPLKTSYWRTLKTTKN